MSQPSLNHCKGLAAGYIVHEHISQPQFLKQGAQTSPNQLPLRKPANGVTVSSKVINYMKFFMEVFILNVQFDPIDFVQVFMYTIISEREALRANKG